MNIIACYNIKGGVGKTATTVNLAYLAARSGAKTLLWDLDPQGASSFYFNIKPEVKGGVTNLIRKQNPLASYIEETDYEQLHLLPADMSNRNLDIMLGRDDHPERQLNKMLQGIMGCYDYIFLDCPPTISLLSENVFHASDVLLIPTIPTTLSLRTLQQITEFKTQNPKMFPRLMAFFSMVDRRKTMHKLIVDRPPSVDACIMKSHIPYAAEVERMGSSRKPLHTFAGSSRAAHGYEKLWQELQLGLSTTEQSLNHY